VVPSATSARRIESIPEPGITKRQLETKAGSVKLKVPKLRSLPFETAIIERYRRREASVEESLVEMYLAECPCDESRTLRKTVGTR